MCKFVETLVEISCDWHKDNDLRNKVVNNVKNQMCEHSDRFINDDASMPIIINALGVMNENDKVDTCEKLAAEACRVIGDNDYTLNEKTYATEVKKLAFDTMFVHSFLPNEDLWTRDVLAEKQQTPAGKEYVKYAVELLSKITEQPVSALQKKYGITL